MSKRLPDGTPVRVVHGACAGEHWTICGVRKVGPGRVAYVLGDGPGGDPTVEMLASLNGVEALIEPREHVRTESFVERVYVEGGELKHGVRGFVVDHRSVAQLRTETSIDPGFDDDEMFLVVEPEDKCGIYELVPVSQAVVLDEEEKD